MSGEVGRAEPSIELDGLLLDAKLTAPQPSSGGVSRAELIEPARVSERRVVGVTAPAGYGKSTLLSQWAIIEDRPVAWVSLDRVDDDPAVLLSLLASAYTRISGDTPDLVADMGGPGVSILGRAAPRLAAAFRTSSAPFVLVLDDLHELRSPWCHDALGVVITGIPLGSQLVAASRSEQPHIPRLRASGDVFEIDARDLALDAAGAEQIFLQAHVPITPESAAAAAERTEGWPAGLYLAALIAKDGGGDVTSIAGDDRYVADYLYRESLIRLPESKQRFLRRTAVLDRLSVPLCDAVLEGSDASDHLLELETSNMFLVPLDRRRGWYRYHGLFREFLLGELRRVDMSIIPKLHLRAADWYEANGSPVLALEHLLHTAERDRCVQLVAALLYPTYQDGQLSTIQRWLAELGDPAVETYPPLVVLAGWAAALTGQTADAQRWAAIADAASFEDVPLDGTASFDSARAMLRAAMCASGPEQMLTDASHAVAQEPPWSPWRDTALVLFGEACLLVGDVERARLSFEQSSAVGTELANTDNVVLSESELAMLAMERGDRAEAGGHVDRTLAVIEELRMHDYSTSVLGFVGAGRLAHHRGDRDGANRQLTRAMRARPSCTFVLPWLAVRVRLQLAKVYWAMADTTTARHLVREIDDVLLHRPELGVLVDEVSEFREVMDSTPQVGTAGGPPLTAAEIRLLPYLQTHLTLREIGDRLFVSRNTVSSEVSSIYRKLGVSSRSEAVEQATVIGLLGA